MNISFVKKIWSFSSLMSTLENYFQTGSIENTVCKVTSSLIANQRKMFRVAQRQYLLYRQENSAILEGSFVMS